MILYGNTDERIRSKVIINFLEPESMNMHLGSANFRQELF